MKRKILLTLLVLTIVFSCNVSAVESREAEISLTSPSFPVELNAVNDGGIVENSQYWQNLSFDEANLLIRQSLYKTAEDFILVCYSRECYWSQQIVPKIKKYAEDNSLLVLGIDTLNNLGGTETSFFCPSQYFDKTSLGYTVVFMYNSTTETMTAQDSVRDIKKFKSLLQTAGLYQPDEGTDDTTSSRVGRTIGEIMAVEKQLPHSGFDALKKTRYEVEPQITEPYSAGSLNSEDMADALNALKMVRFLAGLPYEDIYWDEYETLTSQHKAVLIAVSEYDHDPPKPEDMTDEFYRTANLYSGECISAGVSNISNSILGFIADPGANNIARAGHRMILFNTDATQFGIGYAFNQNARWQDYIAIHIKCGWNAIESYIAWPNAGAFPIQYFNAKSNLEYTPAYPWSITLGDQYYPPERDDIVLKLTRDRDGQTWVFDKDTPRLSDSNYSDYSMHLSVNEMDVIFRPDIQSLGSLKDGDKFTVELSGIKSYDGEDTTLKYDINFFDMEKERTRSDVIFKVKHNGKAVQDAQITIDEKAFYTDETGEAVVRVNNNGNYTYSIFKDGYEIVNDTVAVEEEGIQKNVDLSIIEKMLVNETGELYYVSSDKEELTIPSVIDGINVVSISENAFNNCENLKKLTLYENITQIDETVFDGFAVLKIYVTGGSYAHQYAVSKGIDYELLVHMMGDTNADAVVNIQDVIRLLKHVNNSSALENEAWGDINDDGRINIQDVIRLLKHVNNSDPLD